MTKAQKEYQRKINDLVIEIYHKSQEELNSYYPQQWTQLLSCKAWTYRTEHYIFLMSYNTIVAVYSLIDYSLYDFLRYVYGYTATSTQHIAKFRNQMRIRYGTVQDKFRYYPV